MEITTRPATLDDLVELTWLARAAVAELAPMRGGPVWAAQAGRLEPVDIGLRSDLGDAAQHVTVALIDGVALGYAVTRVDTLRDGRPLGVITDLFVDVGARKVGLGEALMDDVLAWAAERGCFGVDALALPGHRDTKNFFESFGLVARAIVVHRSLGDPADEPAHAPAPVVSP